MSAVIITQKALYIKSFYFCILLCSPTFKSNQTLFDSNRWSQFTSLCNRVKCDAVYWEGVGVLITFHNERIIQNFIVYRFLLLVIFDLMIIKMYLFDFMCLSVWWQVRHFWHRDACLQPLFTKAYTKDIIIKLWL